MFKLRKWRNTKKKLKETLRRLNVSCQLFSRQPLLIISCLASGTFYRAGWFVRLEKPANTEKTQQMILNFEMKKTRRKKKTL